ncbi:Multidrug resistance-associated protein 1 [Phytophthora ramorum]|uniref:Multidrug resistance-associated protein 1 n=1 Tax=Phytophthora ramorum TaxID=164328 RepID=UPI0030B40744|nr:Multidrug resistance-associated protein 1 [Phytophthora ramorum]
MLPSSSLRSSAGSDVFARVSGLSTARAERQPLLSGAPPPQVFAHPVECASLTSRLLLQWVTPSVALANRAQPPTQFQRRASSATRGLQQADVWELPPRARAEPGANALQRAWISSGSLSLVFLKTHGLQFVGLGALHAVVQLCELLGPYALFRGATLLQEQTREDGNDTETGRSLVFWLGALLFSRLLRALLSAFVRAELQTSTLRLMAALQSLVFQKSLRLSNASTREADALYAADVTQLLQGAACLHELWTAPLMLALTLTLVEKFLGVAACGATLGAVVVALVVAQVLKQLQFRSLERLRRTREDRQSSATDMVHAMPAVKLHAWEPAARARVNATRGRELAALWRFQVRGAAEAAFNLATPVLVTTAALAVGYHSTTHPLTPASAFATLALVRLMQTPLRALPEAAIGTRTAWQALRNLSHFMDQEELNPYAVARRDSLGLVAKYDPQDVVVAVEDATLGWATNGPVIFQHLDVTVGAGELLVVHGRPGSGKSSFLSALLGEMQARDGNDGGGGGRVYVGGTVAYCPQQPWLQRTLSVQDNILFGLPFDRRKYQRVLDACALINPLAMLSSGDHTLIQDWMPTPVQQTLLSLARACYSDADVYLLDEPLARIHPRSAARDIFSRCLLGLLRNKTRVVVTTRAEFINSEFVDDAIRFEDGGRLVHTRDIYEAKGRKEQEGDEDSDAGEQEAAEDSWVHYSASGVDPVTTYEPPYFPTEEPANIELLSMENAISTTRESLSERPLREYLSCETTTEAEWNEGEWLLKSIRAYTHAVGGVRLALVVFILLFLWQALQLLSELWVAYWVRPSAHTNLAADQLIYTSLALGAGLLALGYSLGIAVAAVEGARRAFLSLAAAFLHAPLVFFDAFGAGSGRSRSKRLSLARRRELERAFTNKDLTALDTRLPLAVGAVLALGASTLTALLTAAVVIRYYAVLLAPVLYLYVHAAKLYLRPARDLVHLERTARQAARMHTAETLAGARVVRAFGLPHVHRVLEHHFWLLDVAARDAHLGLHIDQWFALRVQMYGALLVGIVATSSFLALRHTLSAGVLALALYEALAVDNGALESLVRVWAWLSPVLPTAARTQGAVRGAEVITESAAYSTAAARRASAPLTPTEVNPSLSWPTKGDLRFDAVSFRDPAAAIIDELTDMFEIGDGGAPPLALKAVSFRLQAGEKVAILESPVASSVSSVGRALLRVHELTAGRIVVDGVDIATLGLRTLRSRVACVSAAAPNTGLYDGSVRTQLDPSGTNIEDERLWASLRAVGLASNVASLDGPLPGVSDLQQTPSKRFLLSLARALLSEPFVVALALAPVLVLPPEDALRLEPEPQFTLDDATLEILQRVVHEELRDATVLLLLPSAMALPQHDQAQRASLLNDVDRVLVVVDGEMAELGAPIDLAIQDPDRLETLAEVPSRLELSDLGHPSEEAGMEPLQEEVEEDEEHVGDAESVTSGELVMDTTDSAVEADTDSAVETE